MWVCDTTCQIRLQTSDFIPIAQVRPPPQSTSRPTQVPGAAVHRGSTARDEPAGGAHSLWQVRRRTAMHMRATADKISSRLRVHKQRVQKPLQLWWQTTLLWAWDRPLPPTAKRADLQLLHEVLHELAIAGPPENASSLVLGEGRKVTMELAARGLGPVGSVQVPPHLWGQWADPCFDWAGRNAPS